MGSGCVPCIDRDPRVIPKGFGAPGRRPVVRTDSGRRSCDYGLGLLGQSNLAIQMKVACLARRSGIWLAAADRDGVAAASDHRVPAVGNHAEITILQLEVNLAALAGIEMNALKTAQGDSWRT